ncbi:MAG TPA: DUF4010 domain-containing protein [Devosia sp.]|nr:DUF4010 domain-containing protein [Devosia sp.]
MDAPDRCSSLNKSSCAAGVVHTWTYNGRIIAQLRWCRGRPRHHVSHVVVRALGARYGSPLAGLTSGFISSTATIGAMGARARKLRRPCFCSVWHLGPCTTLKSIRVPSMANEADH